MRKKIIHVILYAIGVCVMPAGVVCTINAHLGAGGYDALNFVLAEHLHIKTSYAIYGISLLILILAAIIRKSYPRLETFISSFLLGLFTDIWKYILRGVEGNGWISSIAIMVIGMIIVAFAVACYMVSIFPTNPADDLVQALHERGMRVGIAKMGFDIFCVVVAFLLGGEIGVGTILITLGLGPVVDVFHSRIMKLVTKHKNSSSNKNLGTMIAK